MFFSSFYDFIWAYSLMVYLFLFKTTVFSSNITVLSLTAPALCYMSLVQLAKTGSLQGLVSRDVILQYRRESLSLPLEAETIQRKGHGEIGR